MGGLEVDECWEQWNMLRYRVLFLLQAPLFTALPYYLKEKKIGMSLRVVEIEREWSPMHMNLKQYTTYALPLSLKVKESTMKGEEYICIQEVRGAMAVWKCSGCSRKFECQQLFCTPNVPYPFSQSSVTLRRFLIQPTRQIKEATGMHSIRKGLNGLRREECPYTQEKAPKLQAF